MTSTLRKSVLCLAAGVAAFALAGCEQKKTDAPPPGMPPNVQQEFNQRMQQSGAGSGQTAPAGTGAPMVPSGMPGAPGTPTGR